MKMMRVIKKSLLEGFFTENPDAEQPLKTWLSAVRSAEWGCGADILRSFPKAQLHNAGRSVVFEVVRERYYVMAFVEYPARTLSIQRIDSSSYPEPSRKIFH